MKNLLLIFSVFFSTSLSAVNIVSDFSPETQLDISRWNPAIEQTSLSSEGDDEISLNVNYHWFGIADTGTLQSRDIYSIDYLVDDKLYVEMKSDGFDIKAGLNMFFLDYSFTYLVNPEWGQNWFIYDSEVTSSWGTYELNLNIPSTAVYFNFDLMTRAEENQTFTTDFRNLRVAVPEPSSYALIFGGLALVFLSLRRK